MGKIPSWCSLRSQITPKYLVPQASDQNVQYLLHMVDQVDMIHEGGSTQGNPSRRLLQYFIYKFIKIYIY